MKIKKLIVLPCHSVWTPGSTLGEDRDEWALSEFQIEGNDHLCFKEHILKAMQELENDLSSFLVISGGQTKRARGPISELYSYYQLAQAMLSSQVPPATALLERITTEEFARDSFENIVFLICRFFEIHRYYPTKICIVGFQFKYERFFQLHLQEALLFLPENISYLGNSPTPDTRDPSKLNAYFKDLNESERKYAFIPFATDLYGVGDSLRQKRISRNPFNRVHGYAISNPQLYDFVMKLSGTDGTNIQEFLPKKMPWM